MRKYFTLSMIGAMFMLTQGCRSLYHATTVERDKKDGCTVHVILHIGIDGTDGDVQVATAQLNDCFGKTCKIPCGKDSAGCPVITTVEVKKWSALKSDEMKYFHHINMVDSDGLPSYVDDLGTANGGTRGGEWRRKPHPRTYCHEVLHLAGLPDHYCSRVQNAVNGTIKQELLCDLHEIRREVPAAWHIRLPTRGAGSTPCPGHENDMMATLSAYVTCQNILEVVSKAGLSDCPAQCCVVPPTRAVRKTDVPHSSTQKIDTVPRTATYSGLTPLHYGVTLYTGYSGYYLKDEGTPFTKETYNGFNFGIAGDVRYQVCAHGSVGGRLRLFEVSQQMFSQTTTSGSGPFASSQTFNSGNQFSTLGIDAIGEWEFYRGLSLVGGPGVTFDMLTQAQSSGSYTFGGMTSTYGDKTYRKWNGVTKNVTGCFNLGFAYRVPVMGYTLAPFISTRLPFNQMLSNVSFSNYLFELNMGATFFIK